MMTLWSPEFLDQCLVIINEMKQVQPKITSLSVKSFQLDIKNQTSYASTIRKIFNNPSIYQKEINQHLTPHQAEILIDMVNRSDLLQTEADFDYLIGHLPYYKEVLALVADLTPHRSRSNLFIFPLIQEWIDLYCNQITNLIWIATYSELTVTINLDLQSQVLLTHKCIDDLVQNISSIVINLLIQYQVVKPSTLNLSYVMTPFSKHDNYFDENKEINTFLIERLNQIPDLRYNYIQFTNPISSLCVNSGVTFQDTLKHIRIWRREEFKKVLIHELIHYYELEKGNNFATQFPINVSNNYPHYSKEIFTELQTWLFNLLWVMTQSHSISTQSLTKVLNSERKFALSQLCHLLKLYGISEWNQFYGHHLDDQHCLNANSSVLYYYIYKAVILFNPSPITETLLIPQPLAKLTRDQMTSAIVKQIKLTMQSSQFKDFINECLKMSQIENTLRMMRL